MFDLTAVPVTSSLILLNAGISLYALFAQPGWIDRYALLPERVAAHGEAYRLVTSSFLHANLPHLFFNMITLYFFGPYVEIALGILPFLGIYIGSALTASIWPMVKYRHDPTYAAVGASGSIAGVLFAFTLFAPLEKLYIFFIPIGIPAVVFAVAFVAFSFWAAHRPASDPGFMGRIAHEAHLGGALGGLLLTILLEPRVIPHFFLELSRIFA